MAFGQLRDLMTQVQGGARVTTAIGEPVTVGDRVVIPVAEVAYGGGGGGGQGMAPGGGEEKPQGVGGGGGLSVRVRPLGCWVVGPTTEMWLPAIDVNRLIAVTAGIMVVGLATLRFLVRKMR